jgi:hypothetical protein
MIKGFCQEVKKARRYSNVRRLGFDRLILSEIIGFSGMAFGFRQDSKYVLITLFFQVIDLSRCLKFVDSLLSSFQANRNCSGTLNH